MAIVEHLQLLVVQIAEHVTHTSWWTTCNGGPPATMDEMGTMAMGCAKEIACAEATAYTEAAAQGAVLTVTSVLEHPRLMRNCVKGDDFCSGAVFCQCPPNLGDGGDCECPNQLQC